MVTVNRTAGGEEGIQGCDWGGEASGCRGPTKSPGMAASLWVG